jgi:hypothetical protein
MMHRVRPRLSISVALPFAVRIRRILGIDLFIVHKKTFSKTDVNFCRGRVQKSTGCFCCYLLQTNQVVVVWCFTFHQRNEWREGEAFGSQ